MAELQSLLNELASYDDSGDFEGLRNVRRRIIESYPDAAESVEAQYKLGLDLLFRERHIDEAMAFFKSAAGRKLPYWSDAARTSLGLCYLHQNQTQKALFELRRVAFPEIPNAHSVTALTFIEQIYLKENNDTEVAKAQKERIKQLQRLAKDAKKEGDVKTRGYYLYQLGLVIFDTGDPIEGRKVLERAKALGPEHIGADVYRAIIDIVG